MHTVMRLLGAISGLMAALALGLVLVLVAIPTTTWAGIGTVLGISIVLVSPFYLIATKNRNSNGGEVFKGMMVGLNGGLNAVVLTAIFMPEPAKSLSVFFKAFEKFAQGPGMIVLIVGAWIVLLHLLTMFQTLSGWSPFQALLGWSSWLMPMSWIVTGVGLLFVLINFILAGITGNQVEVLKIKSLDFHAKTCSLLMEGGLIHPLMGAGGFDMGNFVFLNRTGEYLTEHETGHNLNLAVFGWVFHFIGALDENVFGGHGDAYSERLADSHAGKVDASAPLLNMWQ
ncbi:MAG TPA: hypothetical protein VF950_30720 [Planctomycetota bacterium]